MQLQPRHGGMGAATLRLLLLLAAAESAAYGGAPGGAPLRRVSSQGAEPTTVEGVLELFGLPGDPELLRGELRARLRGIPAVPSWVGPALESMQCYACSSEACPSGLSMRPSSMLPSAQACEPPDQMQCCETTTSSTTSTTSATSSTSTSSTTTRTTSTLSTTTSTTVTTTRTTTSTSTTTTTSTTPFGGPFDCTADFEDLATAWSGWKLQWCCENEGMGCPTETATSTVVTETLTSRTATSITTVSTTSASSSTSVSQTMTTTSVTTSTVSTSSFTVESGCQSAMDQESACTLWSMVELEWCCRNSGYGCPLYDCDAGLETAEFGWSNPKKSWCCTCMDKGCVTSTFTMSATTKSDTITRTSLSTTTTSTTSSTRSTTSTTTSTTSTHIYCDWSNTTACPCGSVCTGCAPNDFDTSACCVDRCGLEFALGEFGLPLRSTIDLQLQLAAKLDDATLAEATCNALDEAGGPSNCTANLASGERCWAACPDDMIAVGSFSCLDGVTVGVSECFWLAGNISAEETNALTSAVRATLDGSAAGGIDAGSAALWRGVLAAAFGVEPSELARLAVSDGGATRRLGEAAPRGAAGRSSVESACWSRTS
ncbi:unnamed protein product [Prorocentrum cordatum]|uniref:Uncharacterized protein n=1 Tax=Prorocentrum cordatum TaxID=2364126 RepID=A0ABN9PAZ0_9DINO|nr:unnamed protein product [Polarella glacialis]